MSDHKSYVKHVETTDVGRKARSGAVWSVLQILGRHAVNIASTAVMARLISPDDYGLVGMVTTLTALLMVFSDMGLSWATIQQGKISEVQISNLFWVNAIAGLGLWLICIILAPQVADFYGRPELINLTIVLGSGFVLSGIAVQPFALLTRRMHFRKIAIIEFLAIFISAAIGIYLAFDGFGYWALAVQGMAGQAIRLILVIISTKFSIQWPRTRTGTLNLIGFGGLLALNGLLIYFSRNLDNVLIGKYLGTEELGYYNRAYFLMLLPSMLANGVLTNLMVPSLAAFQNDRRRFGSAYRRAVRLVAFVGCPISAGLALTASEAVLLVYGERWSHVIPMLLWLSIAGITQPIYNTTGWLFTATGKGQLYFVVTIVNCIALTLTFLLTVPQGAIAVAMGYGFVMGLVLLWPALYFAHRAAGLLINETFRFLAPVFLAVSLMASAVFVSGFMCVAVGLSWPWVLATKVAVGVIVYFIASKKLLKSMLKDDLISMLPKHLVQRVERLIGVA